MPSKNRVDLIGNLVTDPQMRTFPSGDVLTTFRLATNENWKDKQTGEPVQKSQFHDIVVKNQPLAKIASDLFKKGALVSVEGQLENREFEDREGNKRRVSEVVLNPFRGELILLDRKPQPG